MSDSWLPDGRKVLLEQSDLPKEVDGKSAKKDLDVSGFSKAYGRGECTNIGGSEQRSKDNC